MTKYGHTWRLRLRLNAPCNFSTSPFTKTLRLFFSDPGFRSWPLAKGLTLPLLARQYRFKKAGDCLPPSFSSHPWLLTFWDYNPFATHKFGSSARWKTWARYLPSSINSRLMSFQPKPSNRKKKRREKKKSPSASPLTACCRVEGWACYHGNGLFAPHFSRDLPPTSLPSSARHSASLSVSALFIVTVGRGVWMNIHELKGADGIKTMLPALQHFIVMLKPSAEPTLVNRNTFHTHKDVFHLSEMKTKGP